MKSYLTDKQVKEIYYNVVGDSIANGELNYIKDLMNLAVETAIGEPLAYGVKFKSGMYGSLYNKENEAIDDFINWRHVYGEFEVLPFHKIQELEK